METRFLLTDDIKLKDIHLLMDLLKTKSIRDLARSQKVSPGQISKQVRGLELKLGVQLLERSSHGVEVAAEALSILPYLKGIYHLHLKMIGELRPDRREDFLCFASTSFITTHLLPRVLSEYELQVPNTRFRTIDLPPNRFIPVGLRSGFQLCVHMGDLDWPKTWTSAELGTISWNLYCRAENPIGKRPGLEKVLQYPFVYPVYWSDEGIRYGNDSCPVGISKRILGHETATAVSAAEMVRYTDHIGFLPSLVTNPLVQAGELRKLTVKSWKPIQEKVYLTVKNDYIKQSTFMRLKKLFETAVREEK